MNEGARPWFRDALRLIEGNDVSSRFFYDAEAIKFQLTDYRCFSRAGRPC